MSLPQYTATTYFNTGTISARALQTTFGGNSNDVRFSTYRRNTNQDDTSPVVPDADENSDVSSENNLSAQTFRGTVKEIFATQSGSDTNLNLGSSSVWGGNLNKNVIKNLAINGLIVASSNTVPAATLNAEIYNLRVNVSGQIYGEGGDVSNTAGGTALYLNNTTTRSGASRNIDVVVNDTGRIWAGGGVGSRGADGNTGPTINCYATTTYATNVYFGDNRDFYGHLANAQCAATLPPGYTSGYVISANPTDTRIRCRGGGYRAGDGWNPNNFSGYACATNWDLGCYAISYTNLSGGAAGLGGNPGQGAGWNNRGSWSTNYPLNDAEFNSAGTGGGAPNSPGFNYCAPNGVYSNGNPGATGNSGGQWGSAGAGGGAGAALAGRLYRVLSGDVGTGHLQRIRGTKS
jgi:hypothetical protein